MEPLKQHLEEERMCSSEFAKAVRDTLDVISGKWKLPILGSLINGKKRFKELQRDIPKITARMLSKELRELEMNHMVKRTVYDTIPATVEYEKTAYGCSLDKVLYEMKEWGVQHRKKIIHKSKLTAE
jgi:DNA-binding HxlR family transcriptional regulator